jgi:hypothetical protein
MAADDQGSTVDKDVPRGDSAQAARWAQRWRDLEAEALDLARAMTDPEARRYMLFLAESYRLLAERAEVRKKQLAGLRASAEMPTEVPNFGPRRSTDTTKGRA